MSRQACRILGLLAAALGARFDMYALYFLPIIFKITVITVQVLTLFGFFSRQHLLQLGMPDCVAHSKLLGCICINTLHVSPLM